MTVLPLDAHGLAEVAAALRAGEAVVIPLASPLPYVVAAVAAPAVNAAKGRAPDQPCGLLIADFDAVAPHLDLDAGTVEFAEWIARVELASLMVPLVADAPPSLAMHSRGGFVGMTVAWLPRARPLAGQFPALSVSSANRTSRPVGVTADEVDRVFAGKRLVLDGDQLRAGDVSHGSATIIQVRRASALRVVRDGIQNRGCANDRAAYLQTLERRFVDSQAGRRR